VARYKWQGASGKTARPLPGSGSVARRLFFSTPETLALDPRAEDEEETSRDAA
jgi:hypothetical protein